MILRTQPRTGISLLEVLLALAIFLFSLVAFGQLITVGSDQARDLSDRARASMICRSVLAEVAAGSIGLVSQPESAVEEDPDWMYTLEVTADNIPNLYKARVTAKNQRKDGSKLEISMSQYVVDPTKRGSPDPVADAAADAEAAGTTGTSSTSGTSTSTTSGTKTP